MFLTLEEIRDICTIIYIVVNTTEAIIGIAHSVQKKKREPSADTD